MQVGDGHTALVKTSMQWVRPVPPSTPISSAAELQFGDAVDIQHMGLWYPAAVTQGGTSIVVMQQGKGGVNMLMRHTTAAIAVVAILELLVDSQGLCLECPAGQCCHGVCACCICTAHSQS